MTSLPALHLYNIDVFGMRQVPKWKKYIALIILQFRKFTIQYRIMNYSLLTTTLLLVLAVFNIAFFIRAWYKANQPNEKLPVTGSAPVLSKTWATYLTIIAPINITCLMLLPRLAN